MPQICTSILNSVPITKIYRLIAINYLLRSELSPKHQKPLSFRITNIKAIFIAFSLSPAYHLFTYYEPGKAVFWKYWAEKKPS